MIFLSYNHDDKYLIGTIAEVLAKVFGQDKIFYDNWSIQPGDGIIDKIDKGLKDSKFFFFFVSKNSLNSKMVELEWQNALFKATKNQIKLIPVKIDDCLMPNIILQTSYIDIFGKGFDNGVRQIIDVINGKNSYQPGLQKYENIRGYVKREKKDLIIEFRAETYLEPQSRYLILLDNEEEDFKLKCLSDGMFMSGFGKGLILSSGLKTNSITISVNRGTSPGFPFIIKLIVEENKEIRLNGLMRAVSYKEYKLIPVIEKK